jgi:hypothetical protein
MFDYVDYECECPKCGSLVFDWQTKDLDCTLSKVAVDDISNLYTSCYNCSTWLEFTKRNGIWELVVG